MTRVNAMITDGGELVIPNSVLVETVQKVLKKEIKPMNAKIDKNQLCTEEKFDDIKRTLNVILETLQGTDNIIGDHSLGMVEKVDLIYEKQDGVNESCASWEKARPDLEELAKNKTTLLHILENTKGIRFSWRLVMGIFAASATVIGVVSGIMAIVFKMYKI